MKHIKRKFLLSHDVKKDGYEFMVEQMSNAKSHKNISLEKYPLILLERQWWWLYFSLISCITLCKSATQSLTKGNSDGKTGLQTSYSKGLPNCNKFSNRFIHFTNKSQFNNS